MKEIWESMIITMKRKNPANQNEIEILEFPALELYVNFNRLHTQ